MISNSRKKDKSKVKEVKKIKKIELSLVLMALMLLSGLMIPCTLFALGQTVEQGTAIIPATDLNAVLGTPETNIRFALWNGSSWYELPFTNQASAQKLCTYADLDSNQTYVTSTITTTPKNITSSDVFSVAVPAINGVNASSSQWWTMALALRLFDREAIQLTDGSGYSPTIFVYYEPTGSCIPPDYNPDTSASVAPPLNQTQPNQTPATTGATVATGSTTNFAVLSCSAPQIAEEISSSMASPETAESVYSLQNIISQQFKNTQNNWQSTNPFFLPASGAYSSVILVAQWANCGDPYERILTVDVDNQQVYDSGAIYYNSTVEVNISGNFNSWEDISEGQYLTNTAQAQLYTLQGYGFWEVSLSIYVVYTAGSSMYNINAQEYWAQYYSMPADSSNIVYFPTTLPNGLVYQSGGDVVNIGAISPNGQSATLYLYVQYGPYDNEYSLVDQWNLPSGNSGTEYWESCDITGYCVGDPNVGIGLEIYSSGNWGVQGCITTIDRPCVAPDTSEYWTDTNSVHPGCIDSGSLYYTINNDNYFAGTYSTETDPTGCSMNNGPWDPVFATGISVVTSPSQSYPFEVASLETQVSIWDGSTCLGDVFTGNPTNMAGTSGGVYVWSQAIALNEGAELMSLSALLAGIFCPVASAGLGAGAALLQYMSTNSGNPTTGLNNNGAYQSYGNPNQSYAPFTMLMKSTPDLAGAATLYTIKISATIDFYCPLYGVWLTQQTVNNSFQYYVS